jgi:hypothetical protein
MKMAINTLSPGILLCKKFNSRLSTIVRHFTSFVDSKGSSTLGTQSKQLAYAPYTPAKFEGAIFCGHLVTDMDSIAGAIGAAELYRGIPARASEVNSETKFCLEHWGVELPTPIEEVLAANPAAGVCLVDHQQTSQLNPAIKVRSTMQQSFLFV